MTGLRTRRQFLNILSAIGVGAAVGLTSSRGRAQESQSWSEFGANNRNTGYAPSNTGPIADIQEEWAVDIGGNDISGSSPIVENNTIYLVSDQLYALSEEDGSTLWTFEISARDCPSPAVDDGSVYVSDGSNLYALNAETGGIEWESSGGGIFNSSPTVSGDTAYISGLDNLYAVNTQDGTLRWRFEESESGETLDAKPAVADDTVYAWDRGAGNLHAVDLETGSQEWQFQTPGEHTNPPSHSVPVVTDGTVYINSDGSIYAIDATNGSEQWRLEVGEWISQPAVAGESIYFGSSNSIVQAIDATDGTERWVLQDEDRTVFTAPAVVGNTVYVGTLQEVLYGINAENGEKRWSFALNQDDDSFSPIGPPAVANSTIYVQRTNDSIHAFSGTPGQSPSTATATATEDETEATGDSSNDQAIEGNESVTTAPDESAQSQDPSQTSQLEQQQGTDGDDKAPQIDDSGGASMFQSFNDSRSWVGIGSAGLALVVAGLYAFYRRLSIDDNE